MNAGCKPEVVVDGVRYVRAPEGSSRAVVVVDRGWVFAGDVEEETDGRIRLRLDQLS